MYRLLLFIPLALLLVAFQASALNSLTLAGGRIDIIIISLVLLTLYASLELGILATVLVAPLVDVLSGLPLGVSIIPMLSVVLLAHWGGRTIFGARLGWPVVIIFLGVLVAGLITMTELAILGLELPWTDIILHNLIPSAFFNALAALLIYLPIVILGERRETHL